MKIIKNVICKTYEYQPFAADLFIINEQKDWLIFCHGFKGFKDWGCWDLMAKKIAKQANLNVVTMNFSLNGLDALNEGTEFTKLDSFGQNNYSTELLDIRTMINFLAKNYGAENISLMGHSRGGGTVLCFAAQGYVGIKSVITMGSVHRLDFLWLKEDMLKNWEKNEVHEFYNKRIDKHMPIYYQYLYKDFEQHQKEYAIEYIAQNITCPVLLIHGEKDETISIDKAEEMFVLFPDAEKIKLKDAGHTFGAKHPWDKDIMPKELEEAVENIVRFLEKIV